MTGTVRLLPASPHVTVRDPVTRKPLPSEGGDVPLDTYWSRRLVDGDVMVQPGTDPASAKALQRAPNPAPNPAP